MILPQRNLLSEETSPYLRQHADNPVHWRAWGQQALAEAADLDRPILLSVGYAACHWCHVMAHESFEDVVVAEVMNRLFVNIKVDREERPDIDQIYMAALSAMGEQGGWPLTMFLTPDARPFWGGTYFPTQPRYGRPGFVQVLEAVAKAWRGDRVRIGQSADSLKTHVSSRLDTKAAPQDISPQALSDFSEAVASMMDPQKGSLRGAPKFPNAPILEMLWLSWQIDGKGANRDHVLRTLEQMLAGGIYDQIGGGLARYATDADWTVPHFEKMLYDNAQLIRLCNRAYSETGEELFRNRIEQTIEWLRRDMMSADGGFVSSFDADSEGEEGLFYTWTADEITYVLGDRTESFNQYFTLSHPSQWEGKPIIRQTVEQAHLSAQDAASGIVDELRTMLLAARSKRFPPGRDDKVLVDWNGLAIRAVAEAGRALARPDWIALATKAFAAIVSRADATGRLSHSILGATALRPALSSDYAAMTNAAISLYEATGNRAYLDNAAHFIALLHKWHGDEARSGHYLTASDAADVPIRIRGDVDEAIPSATSQIIEALARDATLTADDSTREAAWASAAAAMGRVQGQPYGQAGIYAACAVLLNARKLVIVDDATTPTLVPVANRVPDSRRVDTIVALGTTGTETLPGGVTLDRTKVAAYLCEGLSCRPPIHEPVELRRVLMGR